MQRVASKEAKSLSPCWLLLGRWLSRHQWGARLVKADRLDFVMVIIGKEAGQASYRSIILRVRGPPRSRPGLLLLSIH